MSIWNISFEEAKKIFELAFENGGKYKESVSEYLKRIGRNDEVIAKNTNSRVEEKINFHAPADYYIKVSGNSTDEYVFELVPRRVWTLKRIE